MIRARLAVMVIAALVAASDAAAHVGSADVFLDGQAGPYRLLVTVRPPHAIPGVADVDILTTADDVRGVRIVPLPLTGPGAQLAPVADVAVPAADDPRMFSGHLWMMTAGAWQVRITVSGDRGPGELSVPVPTLPQSTLVMERPRQVILFALMLLLAAGAVGIVSAIAREGTLAAGDSPDRRARRRGRIAGAAAVGVIALLVFLGDRWWDVEASRYERYVYKPLEAAPSIAADGALRIALRDPGWITTRRIDDLVPDHGHLMHLFIVSPALDRLWHLHPDERAPGVFEQRLPAMPDGTYQLFGDVVHATGVSETVTGQIDARAVQGAPLTGDDSAWDEQTVRLKPDPTDNAKQTVRLKPDLTDNARSPVASGFSRTSSDQRIVWINGQEPLVPKRLTLFTFRLEDAAGQPASDLQPYMGMAGHAIFMRRDLRVFAHVHPAGSAPMAALNIAMPPAAPHGEHAAAAPATVSFPYGFPERGDYRIFVQMKRQGRVVTGAFEASVR